MAFTEGICEKVQGYLNDMVSDQPSLKRTQVGYLSALQSAENTAGITQIPVDPGNGKKKIVRLKYIKRAIEDDVIETKITDCSTDVERTPFDEDVEVTSYIGSPGIKFTVSEMRKLCESDKSWMQTIVNAEIDAIIKKLNKNLITTQNSNFGTFNGGATGKNVVLLTGEKRIPNFAGEADIMGWFEDLDVSGRPIVVGAGILSHYARAVGIGCCNQDGINLAQAGNLNYYRDRFVEGILGTNKFIGLVPGMVQLMTWNEYVGEYAKENGTFSHGTIMDPVTGLKFDQRWHYNDCDDTYSLNLGLYYDLHFLPTDAFDSNDELYGYNGTLKFTALQADDYCC